MGEAGHDLAMSGLDGLVLGRLSESEPSSENTTFPARSRGRIRRTWWVWTDRATRRSSWLVSFLLRPSPGGRPSRIGSTAVSATSTAADWPSATPRCRASAGT